MFYTGGFFTAASLESFAKESGFSVLEHKPRENLEAWTQRMEAMCSRRAFDLRIGAVASSSLGTAYTPTIKVNYTALSHRPHVNQGNLREFFSKTWDYLRAAHRLNVDRRTGLRVCVPMHQYYVAPLGHAAGLYPDEARMVVRRLSFTQSFPATLPRSGHAIASSKDLDDPEGRRCAYVFFSRVVAFRTRATAAGNGSITQEWIPFDPVLLKQINSSIELAKTAGLSCARINSMTRPVDAASSLAKLFEDIGTSAGQSRFIAAHAPKIPMIPGRMSAHSNMNLRERFLASSSPLLITMAGTHWSDWTLYKRSLEGRPSAVIGDEQRDRFLGAPPPPPLFQCDERNIRRCAAECVFHRSVCINRTAVLAGAADFGDALAKAPHGGVQRIADMERPDGIVFVSSSRSKIFDAYVQQSTEPALARAPHDRKHIGR